MTTKRVKVQATARQFYEQRLYKTGEFFEVDGVKEAKSLAALNFVKIMPNQDDEDVKPEVVSDVNVEEAKPVVTKDLVAEDVSVEDQKHPGKKSTYKTREVKSEK